MREQLTAARLRALLDYDRSLGYFSWRVARGNQPAGALAGTSNGGYFRIRIDGVQHLAHRLAWLHVTGKWPQHEVDHRDGDGFNNSWLNLRDATKVVNQQNQKQAQSSNRVGLLGVSTAGTRYRARIRYGGEDRHLGRFDTAEAAHAAYLAVKRQHHEGNML